jgi:hypothetical protein
MNIWIVYRANDRRVMVMFQLLYEAAHYANDHKEERMHIVRTDPANLERGKDWFTLPLRLDRWAHTRTYTPTESGEFRNA